MSWIVVDVEADGPVPGLYSMISFAAIIVDKDLNKTFKAFTCPISEKWDSLALHISCASRDEHLQYPHPANAMRQFVIWLKENSKGHPVFISDNLAFDWQFINYYFHSFIGKNPFGFSGRRIGDLYCGLVKDAFAKWKHLRDTEHTHDPLDDVRGNAEVILKMKDMGLNVPKI